MHTAKHASQLCSVFHDFPDSYILRMKKTVKITYVLIVILNQFFPTYILLIHSCGNTFLHCYLQFGSLHFGFWKDTAYFTQKLLSSKIPAHQACLMLEIWWFTCYLLQIFKRILFIYLFIWLRCTRNVIFMFEMRR